MNFVKPESVENKYNLTSTSQQYPAPQNSGRVPDVRTRDSTPALHLYKPAEPIYKDLRKELIGHQHTATPLNTTFFSDANIETIHQRISDQVFAMSGSKHRIDRQSDDDVKLIMRSYYLMFGQNNPDNVAAWAKNAKFNSINKLYEQVIKEQGEFLDSLKNGGFDWEILPVFKKFIEFFQFNILYLNFI
jgi:hypothetical protein